MMSSIHGHEVLEMIMSSGCSYTKASLRSAIDDRFGRDARFYTCSAENMTAEELIEFLAQRGKFMDQAEGFVADPTKICKHEDE